MLGSACCVVCAVYSVCAVRCVLVRQGGSRMCISSSYKHPNSTGKRCEEEELISLQAMYRTMNLCEEEELISLQAMYRMMNLKEL